MFKWLDPYAKPENAYHLCNQLLPYFGVLALLGLPVGFIWGLAFAPADYQQGDAFRIIYVHVPAAILAMSTYVAMAIAGFIGLVWQWKTAYLSMIAIAPVGAMMTFISLFTGAIWGKPMWGTWWIWDARLTSQLILLFLYLGVMMIYQVIQDKQQAGKAAAVIGILGVINIPIIHYSVEWWNTLHQGATITKIGAPAMAPEMLWPLLISIIGTVGIIGWLSLINLKNQIIAREAHRAWVRELLGAKHGL